MGEIIIINGGLRIKKSRNFILTIYSTPLARFIIDKKIKQVDAIYDFDNKQFILKKGIKKKICIERKKEDHPLCILHVGRIIGRKLPRELKKDNKQRRVKVILKDITNKKELLRYNKLISYIEPNSRLSTHLSEADSINLACSISCFKNKNGTFCYRFSARHKILEEIALKKERVILLRDSAGKFIIRKYKFGRIFNFSKTKRGYPIVYMQMSPSLIKKEENKLFEEGKRSFSSRIILSQKEFKIDIYKFFMTREERELAYALLKKNINIRIPQMGKREADIVLKDNGAQIEVTNLMPRNEDRHKNNAHGEGIHINARLGEGFIRVTKKIIPYYFLILNISWKKYKWVQETCKLVEPNVITLYTDFNGNWSENITKKIISEIKLHKENDNLLGKTA